LNIFLKSTEKTMRYFVITSVNFLGFYYDDTYCETQVKENFIYWSFFLF
jgi:hypothetical protein